MAEKYYLPLRSTISNLFISILFVKTSLSFVIEQQIKVDLSCSQFCRKYFISSLGLYNDACVDGCQHAIKNDADLNSYSSFGDMCKKGSQKFHSSEDKNRVFESSCVLVCKIFKVLGKENSPSEDLATSFLNTEQENDEVLTDPGLKKQIEHELTNKKLVNTIPKTNFRNLPIIDLVANVDRVGKEMNENYIDFKFVFSVTFLQFLLIFVIFLILRLNQDVIYSFLLSYDEDENCNYMKNILLHDVDKIDDKTPDVVFYPEK